MRLIIVGKAGELLDALQPLILMFGGYTPLSRIPPTLSKKI
jgi:hypothetical protein